MLESQSAEVEVIEAENGSELKKLFQDRKRTNILNSVESAALLYFVKRLPGYITPNILTGIAIGGSFVMLISFILATFISSNYLLLGIVGLFINWFGDSLDGRVAYYRQIPRKWYGFSLDIIMDWVSVIFMGFGYMIYAKGMNELLAYSFVVLYGWAMIIAILRYKINNQYTIDAGYIGPTELRVIVALILIMEIIIPNFINYCMGLVCLIFIYNNIKDTNKLLDLGDIRDKKEKAEKENIE